MSQVVGRPETTAALLAALYGPVQAEMVEVEEMLRRELRSDDPFVDELAKYGFRISGKRLRPALVLLAAKSVGRATRDHIVLATVLEMIHTATLVHDDVLDEAAMRRHLDTVNARWSNEASVLLGDYLFTHSFYLASTLETTYACRTIGRATNIVCDGELRQVHHRGNLGLTEAEYLQIIEAKTAELTSCCCQLGAHYAGATPEQEDRLSSFGRNLGIAFQIADDLLDLEGDEHVAGKSLGTDLEKRKATLPLIRALDQADLVEREEISSLILAEGGNHRTELRAWLDRFEALDYARRKARYYADQAQADLSVFPESESIDTLRGLTEFVVNRRQ
jgi:octaprenyl-diphosphate synthase